jgi:hypothetical protein
MNGLKFNMLAFCILFCVGVCAQIPEHGFLESEDQIFVADVIGNEVHLAHNRQPFKWFNTRIQTDSISEDYNTHWKFVVYPEYQEVEFILFNGRVLMKQIQQYGEIIELGEAFIEMKCFRY